MHTTNSKGDSYMKNNKSDSIAQNIKKYRLLNKMTQEELANELNLDPQYYAQLERGERNFTIEKIICICSLFHIGIENIITIPTTNSQQTHQLLHDLNLKMESLSYTQLLSIDKFIEDILPYIK